MGILLRARRIPQKALNPRKNQHKRGRKGALASGRHAELEAVRRVRRRHSQGADVLRLSPIGADPMGPVRRGTSRPGAYAGPLQNTIGRLRDEFPESVKAWPAA